MNIEFKQVATYGHFITRTRRLAQKTSERTARFGRGPAYRFRSREMAVPVPIGLTCPYMAKHYHEESKP